MALAHHLLDFAWQTPHIAGMADKYDLVISGGGLTGPLLALAAAKAGFCVAVLDAAPSATHRADDFDGRAYALSLASRNMLSALGLWDALAPQAQPINDIKVSHGQAGKGASPFFVHFDSAEIDQADFGHLIEDRVLRRALLDQMADSAVAYMPSTRLVSVVDGQVTAVGARGGQKTLDARLVIGADGRKSEVARQSGISRLGWDYAQSSLVCAVEHERPHNGVAHQFFSQAGPLAILPLPGNKSSIVWTESKARADAIQQADDADYLAALRPIFGDFLGDVALAGRRFTYPLGLSLADRFVARGVALVGDAAHGIHPLAGQGLNLGFRDVAALAEVLVDANRRGEDFAALNVLERYQAWRRFDTVGMAVATDTINRAFLGAHPLLAAGRDLGMQALGALPGARRLFMREATGTSGDVPRLLTGEPI